MSNKPLTAEDILTSSGKYPERAKLASDIIKLNAEKMAESINSFLDELGYTGPRVVSSGYRPAAANAAAGGSKGSYHMQAMACDLEDVYGLLGKLIRANKGVLLRKYRMFMEKLERTKTWVHLDKGVRADRPDREFNP